MNPREVLITEIESAERRNKLATLKRKLNSFFIQLFILFNIFIALNLQYYAYGNEYLFTARNKMGKTEAQLATEVQFQSLIRILPNRK